MSNTVNQYKIPLIEQTDTNARKIPQALFIENIDAYIDKYGVELVMQEVNTLYSKYKYMEAQILKHNDSIGVKIPDIEKTLQAVEFLKKKNEENQETVVVDYALNNNLWAKAAVDVTETVFLWLGADIMCEFSHKEAIELLEKNLNNAQVTKKMNDEDLDFLKDQITTCEVNIARVHNANVVKNQNKK